MMKNKEKIKKVINNDFSKANNYKAIIETIDEDSTNIKRKSWKWSLVPICLIVIISGFFFMKTRNNNLTKPNESLIYDNNIELNINDVNSYENELYVTESSKTRYDVKEIPVDGINIPWPEILIDGITIPKDLDKFNGYRIFTRKDKTSKYDILNCTVYNYSNKSDSNVRNIRIAVSDTNKPIRCYTFSRDNSKDSIINNVKLTIFKYDNTYYAEFIYKDYYFDIETSNVSEKELIDLLASIIE